MMHFQSRITGSKRKPTESVGTEDGAYCWNCTDGPGFGLGFITALSCGFGQVTLPLMKPQCTLQKLETGLYKIR